MATTVPAIHGQMGTIEYYQTKMRARELTATARPASEESDRWANLTIEERLQRDLNMKRVREEIIPYLAKAEDRFFGSILVLAEDPDVFEFESLHKLVKDVPAAYRRVVQEIGVLTIDGGRLIILDGQHRWAALRSVIQGQDDRGNPIEGEYASDVANDELVVVFVKLDLTTTRRIFNKINRNAKTTSRGDNIITSEDDGVAIVTRLLLEPGAPLGSTTAKGDMIVNWKSNTLADRSPQITTISAVYETVKDMLAHYNMKDEFDEKKNVVRPTQVRIDKAYDVISTWWQSVLDDLTGFQDILSNMDRLEELRKDPDYEYGLLLKPAAHIVLFRALVKAVQRGVDLPTAIQRASGIDWKLSSPMWRDILILSSGRIVAREENYNLSAELIAYLISADKMTGEDKETLETAIAKFRGMEPGIPLDTEDGEENGYYALPAAVV